MPGVHKLNVYLCVSDVDAAMAFYEDVFGAKQTLRLASPEGSVMHAEMQMGDITLMLSEPFSSMGVVVANPDEGHSVSMHLEVDNCDAIAEQAVSLGATLLTPPEDQFHGERSCRLLDPFGHRWLIGHKVEQVSNAEIQRRFDAMFK